MSLPPDTIRPANPRIYLAFHQLQRGFFPALTIISPSRCLSLLRKLGLTIDSDVLASEGSNAFELRISFDDGYSELATLLPQWLPILKTKPIVFIPTGWIGQENRWDYLHRFTKSRHLAEVEIRMLANLGVEFGSHGHRHIVLNNLPDTHLQDELQRSKRTLEELVDRAVSSIAYPYGLVNERVRNMAKEAGYTHGYAMNLPGRCDLPLEQGRVPVYSIDTLWSLNSKLPGHPLQATHRLLNRVIRAGATLGSAFNNLSDKQ